MLTSAPRLRRHPPPSPKVELSLNHYDNACANAVKVNQDCYYYASLCPMATPDKFSCVYPAPPVPPPGLVAKSGSGSGSGSGSSSGTSGGADTTSGGADTCGDSKIMGAETCDDGNLVSGDGCHGETCKIESGWACWLVPSICCGPCANLGTYRTGCGLTLPNQPRTTGSCLPCAAGSYKNTSGAWNSECLACRHSGHSFTDEEAHVCERECVSP